MENSTFSSLCIQSKGGKYRICLKFAIISKNNDNLVFFLIFGRVVNDIKTKYLQAFTDTCKFGQTLIFAPFYNVSKSDQMLVFGEICSG